MDSYFATNRSMSRIHELSFNMPCLVRCSLCPMGKKDSFCGEWNSFLGILCQKAFCHAYWGCRGNGCDGCLKAFGGVCFWFVHFHNVMILFGIFPDFNFGDGCMNTILLNNQTESKILNVTVNEFYVDEVQKVFWFFPCCRITLIRSKKRGKTFSKNAFQSWTAENTAYKVVLVLLVIFLFLPVMCLTLATCA